MRVGELEEVTKKNESVKPKWDLNIRTRILHWR